MAKLVPFAQVEVILEQLIQSNSKAVLLVTSEKNQDGSYWCPDCEAIKPLYPTLEKEAAKAGLPYFILVAGDRPTWKNPENKLRKHPAIQAKSVPTLGLFDGKKLVRRLVEGEIMDSQQRALIYE